MMIMQSVFKKVGQMCIGLLRCDRDNVEDMKEIRMACKNHQPEK